MINRWGISKICAILITVSLGGLIHFVFQLGDWSGIGPNRELVGSGSSQSSAFPQNPVQEDGLSQHPIQVDEGRPPRKIETTLNKGEFQPAAMFTVSNETELASAITTANGNNQSDIIDFIADIPLTTGGFPSIGSDGGNLVTINGGGFTLSRTSGSGNTIAISNGGVVAINNLTISNLVVLSSSPVQNSGTLTLTSCIISDSTTQNAGGGVINQSNIALYNCIIANNRTDGSTFNGGGLQNNGSSCIINGCTISGNTSTGGGGGFRTTGGTVIVTNSTFSDNIAQSSTGGGGISISGGAVSIINCTIASNTASNTSGPGGGIQKTGGTLNLTNTIVSNNTTSSTSPAPGPDIFGTVNGTPLNNLIGIGDGGLTGLVNGVNGNQVGTSATPIDPLLGLLQNNGGLTPTRAIDCASPAREAGTITGAPATDQRGMPRDATPDIGAFEEVSTDCNSPVGLLVADTTNHRIQAFDGTEWVVLGVGTVGTGDGQFRLPEAVTFDATGRIYVADTGNHRIQWSTDGGVTWMNFAANGAGLDQVRAPQGLALDTDGNLYVSDTGNGRVMRFNGGVPGNGVVIASNGTASGQVGSPRGLAIDANFRLFVTDESNSRILRISNAHTTVSATSGAIIATLGTALNKVKNPQGITIDGSGTLFVADTGNSRILRWVNANPNNATTMALTGSGLGQVNRPEGVTVTQFAIGPFSGGSFLVVGDTSNNRIQGRPLPTGGWTLIGAPNGIGTGVGQFRAPSKIR